MPFVRNNSKVNQTIFVGRQNELQFFSQNILQPNQPLFNIIWLHGQAGVGKSSLMAHFRQEAANCLVAIAKPALGVTQMIEDLAHQLNLVGFTPLPTSVPNELLQHTHDLKNRIDQHLTLIDDPLETTRLTLKRNQLIEYLAEWQQTALTNDPVVELTQRFVEQVGAQRVLLFFDTVEYNEWLLNSFLANDISGQIVLIMASRETPRRANAGQWQPYLADKIMCNLNLTNFNLAQTRTYLALRGISNPEQIATAWQLSHGLPLYLNLLASGIIDPTADIVANFLRGFEPTQQRLALEAALFSNSFDQDDLVALTSDKPAAAFQWLSSLPFIEATNGRIRYNEAIQELFCRYLYQSSHHQYSLLRKKLIAHYEAQLSQLDEDLSLQPSLYLAIAYQAFLLSGKTARLQALRYTMLAYAQSEQPSAILSWLRTLRAIAPATRQSVQVLLDFIEAKLDSTEFVVATDYLLEHWAAEPVLLAQIYRNRGNAFAAQKQYEKALVEFNRSIELDSTHTRTYADRANVYLHLKNISQALADYQQDQALRSAWLSLWLKLCLAPPTLESSYEFEQLAVNNTGHYLALVSRAVALALRKQFAESLLGLRAAYKQNPTGWEALFWLGYICVWLGDEAALTVLEKALATGMPPALLLPLRWLEKVLF